MYRFARTTRRKHAGTVRLLLSALALPLTFVPAALHAQTDFFNTDGGRPLRVQDAHAVEWRALELQFAPLRLERHQGSGWRASVEPEIAFGLLPRTHVGIGFPIASVDRPGIAPVGGVAGERLAAATGGPAPTVIGVDPSQAGAGQINGLAGVHLSVMHQLNVETRIPAFAVRGEVLLPAGPLGPDKAYPSLTGIVTRTLPQFGAVRVHGNASVTFGSAPDATGNVPTGPVAEDVPRWLAGVSVDRAFPLKFSLLAMELVARQGMIESDPVNWSAAAGIRHQFSPRIVMDLGVGRQFTGLDQHWSITFGSAVALGLGRRLF